MGWLRDHLDLVIGAVAVLLVVGWVQAELRAAEYRGEARIHEAAADRSQALADSLGQAVSTQAELVMAQRDRYAVDSLEWAERNAQNRAQIASLTQRGQRTADALRERLDSAGTALLAEYEATVDSVVATYEVRVADLTAERASLWAQRESLAELVEGLQAENAALRDSQASLRASLDAMERAESAGGLLPDLGAFTDPLLIAGGALLGYGLATIVR